MANITGEFPQIERVPTGFYSLDWSLGGGWPMTTIELYGFAGVFKSTFSLSILATVSNFYKKKLLYAPVEPADKELVNNILDSVKFSQEMHISMEKTDEELIDTFCELLGKEEYCAGLFDSLTSISPIMEMESSSADMNMGRRARLTGVLARKLVHLNRFRTSPVTSILLSPVTPSLSVTPTNTGSSTSGGEVKKNLSKVRIKVRLMQEPTMKELEDENAIAIEGMIEKYNFGRDKRKFHVVILGGKGIHKGMTAMYDCKTYGICTFGRSITLGSNKYGSMKSIVEKAHAGEDKFFEPFIEALKNPSKVEKPEKEDDWEEEDAE
jgi:RecA/RadA recombinase